MKLREKWAADSKQFASLHLEKQTRAVIFGLAVGDALGVPVEFRERGSFVLKEMIGHGTYDQPIGTWSDDTSLTLALMEHLAEKSGVEQLLQKFVDYREGYLTPAGVCFDIGVSTNQAIERYLSGVSLELIGGDSEWDNGNGALMRISPLAIVLQEEFDFSKKVEVIETYTKLTHRHPRALVASILYVQLLIGLLLNNSLKESMDGAKVLFLQEFPSAHPYRREFETYFADLFSADFFEQDESYIRSTGYVVDTLKAVIWCLGNSTSFEESLLKAVNLGGDTDTIGAITGTLAGALYKFDSIPEKWLSQLVCQFLIQEKIVDFVRSFSG